MALKQSVTNEKGASTIYHRIAKADLDFNTRKAELVVYSYATASLREAEKAEFEDKIKLDELTDRLNELVANPTEENEQERIELSEQINALPPITEVTERHLVESTYKMSIHEEISMEEIYIWLKNEVFTDSTDV